MKNKPNLSVMTIDYGRGGTERVISLILKELVKNFNVTLVIFYDYVEYELPEEVEIKILLPKGDRINSIFRKVKDTLIISQKYSKFIRQNKIDISMTFLALPNIINGIMAMKHKKLKTIISERCFPSIMYKENKSSEFLANYVIPFFYSRNDHLFSNSIYINEDLKKNYKVNLTMSVIYNPIIIDKSFIKSPSSFKISETFTLINVGSIYPPKNQKLILEALKLLNDKSYKLKQLGDGSSMEYILGLTKKLELEDQVQFFGRIPQVKENLKNSDCFILSSNTEGFPNVLLEAMSIGLPVISTNCMSGPLELLNDNKPVEINTGEFYKAKYGLLINTEDIIALAKAISFYRENMIEWKYYGQQGLKRAKDFELPKIYKQLQNILLS